ncbi:Acetyltransferase (GNAT) family protein [Tistlia consotensis]|uniref:Acetyltransferase (GNAT) family protein n=1 Tax=Tistlia consotensis USBA 355 TaxID=560819 RepID=A0A1Y6CEX4_9PROT|nr:GNAT family N-acetyltransferase [Tistlia consotensis]SMF60765.1 Acetyltransferase (GNAT) family protein [Tistlia consotensis USBA 355]SNR92799.1 Acetyltransferase (GNAT) family protein [Tistlia consotensis]
MPQLELRPVAPEDIGRLTVLLMETYAFYGDPEPIPASEVAGRLRRYLGAQPGYEAVLASSEGVDIGYAIYAPVFWTSDCRIALFLKEIFVLERWRNRGVGRDLMRCLARIARQRDWPRIVWTVDRRNRPALRFYRTIVGAREVNKDVYVVSGESLRRLAD